MRNIAKRLKKKARQLGQNCDGEFEALKALGRAQMEAGEHAKALGSFTSAKELKPQDAPVAALIKEAKRQLAKDAALKKAKGELAVKDFEEAAADFQKALDLDPKDAAVAALVQECERKAKAQNLRKIGEAELADKDYENAANTLLSALFLNPDDETAVVEHDEALAKAQAMELQRAGEQLMANQDFEHAIRVFVEALELFPDSKDIADEEQVRPRAPRALAIYTMWTLRCSQGKGKRSALAIALRRFYRWPGSGSCGQYSHSVKGCRILHLSVAFKINNDRVT